MARIFPTFVILILTFTSVFAQLPEKLLKAKNSVVTIEARISKSAFGDTGRRGGTGFLINKEKGLIATNAHVVTYAAVGDYMVKFYNGKKVTANLLYYGNYEDIAILQIDPREIPAALEEIKFSQSRAYVNQKIYLIGFNEGKDYSIHEGHISNLYSIDGVLPQHSYILSMNSAGGSSGSPVLTGEGEYVALNYAGSKTYGIALKGESLNDVAYAAAHSKTPIRNNIGATYALYSINDAERFRNLPSRVVEDYMRGYSQYKGQIITVRNVIKGSPAEGKLKNGDIIWAIDSKICGADLYSLFRVMDSTKADSVTLTIYRDGNKLEKNIALYDTNKTKVTKFLQLAGSYFFASDDAVSMLSGMSMGSIVSVYADDGSAFTAPQYRGYQAIRILSVFGSKIKTLESLASFYPKMQDSKYFSVSAVNFCPYRRQYNNLLNFSHSNFIMDVVFSPAHTKDLYNFEPKKGGWRIKSN